jgi:hypothetical protein
MVAVPVEEQSRERKLPWCFLMAEVNPTEEVAIADLVGESFDLFRDGGHVQSWQRKEAVLLTLGGGRIFKPFPEAGGFDSSISRIDAGGFDGSLAVVGAHFP